MAHTRKHKIRSVWTIEYGKPTRSSAPADENPPSLHVKHRNAELIPRLKPEMFFVV